MTPKRPSTVETAFGIINRKPIDLNQDGQVSKAEEELVPTPPSIAVPKTPAATTVASPTMAFGLGRGLKNIANSPKTLPAVLAAGMGLAGMYGAMYGGKGVPAQQSSNVTSPINDVSPTNPVGSPFESPPDPGQRKWTPYNVFTNPDRMSPIREQQEITGYYRQALTQRLEEASAAFWAYDPKTKGPRAGANRKDLEAAEKQERIDTLAPFEKMEPNKYPVRNMPVKKKKEVESVPLKREDRFQFPNDPVTRGERNLKWLSDPRSAPSTPSGPTIQQPLIPSDVLHGPGGGLAGRLKAAEQWWAGETTETTLPSGEIKQVRRGAPLLDSDKIAATEIKKKLMAIQSRRGGRLAQPTTPRETFDAEGVDMTMELPNLPKKISPSRQSQIAVDLETELAREHGTVEEPKEHAGDDIDDDTAIDTKLPEVPDNTELSYTTSHVKREDASKTRKYEGLEKLYPASSRVSSVGVISTEGSPMSKAQTKIDARAAKQRRSHAALHDIYGNVFNLHSGSAIMPNQYEKNKVENNYNSETGKINKVKKGQGDDWGGDEPNFDGRYGEREPVLRNSDGQLTGRTDVSSTTSWPQLVAQELSQHKYSIQNPVIKTRNPKTRKEEFARTEIPVVTPFKDEFTSTGRLRKTPLHPVRQALSQVSLHEPHTFAALLPHVDDATRASLQQHMDYLAKNSARNVDKPVNNTATLLKNISRLGQVGDQTDQHLNF